MEKADDGGILLLAGLSIVGHIIIHSIETRTKN
jgi:hypothetical protein